MYASPSLGETSPVNILNVVVLPAPKSITHTHANIHTPTRTHARTCTHKTHISPAVHLNKAAGTCTEVHVVEWDEKHSTRGLYRRPSHIPQLQHVQPCKKWHDKIFNVKLKAGNKTVEYSLGLVGLYYTHGACSEAVEKPSSQNASVFVSANTVNWHAPV